MIELTYNWGVDSYELGTAYGHIALSVDNAAEACERIRQNGGNVTREAGPVKGGTTVIAFVEDPDGYKIELIEERCRQRSGQLTLPHAGIFNAMALPGATAPVVFTLPAASRGKIPRSPAIRN